MAAILPPAGTHPDFSRFAAQFETFQRAAVTAVTSKPIFGGLRQEVGVVQIVREGLHTIMDRDSDGPANDFIVRGFIDILNQRLTS